jgi:hypothetical protein
MISVLLPVHNGAAYIAEAVGSLNEQTYNDWELILVDDASTDDSVEIVSAIVPPGRLTVIQHQKRVGVAVALNSGLKVASRDYVARMDADDVNRPERLAWQREILKEHPDLHVVFGWYQMISAEGAALHTPRISRPISAVGINPALLIGNPLSHPTACFNRAVAPGWHYPEDQLFEDYALWLDKMVDWRVCIDPRVVIAKRMHSAQQSRVGLRQGNDLLLPAFRQAAARHGVIIDADVARLMLRPDQLATLDTIRAVMRHQRALRSQVEVSGETDASRIALHLQLLWTHEGLRNWDLRTRVAVLRALNRTELSMLSRVVRASAQLKRPGG